jgi:FtsP/CotA-like multicopper oxidase with cupredoxin domain
MELESYYDGVAGWSGAGARTASMIAPGDSFVVRLTPRRAGTFIYHTHLDHLNQLTGGLYGALLVLPPRARPDGAERMIIFADSSAPNMRGTPPSMINGTSAPAPIELCAGVTHRLRFVSITALTFRRVRLLDDTTLVSWKVLAKDGQELPPAQQVVMPAMARFGAGETRDVAFTPSKPGPLTLEVTSIFGRPRVTRVSMVVRAPAHRAHGATPACSSHHLQ